MTQTALATQQNEAKGLGKSSTTVVDRVGGGGPGHLTQVRLSSHAVKDGNPIFLPVKASLRVVGTKKNRRFIQKPNAVKLCWSIQYLL